MWVETSDVCAVVASVTTGLPVGSDDDATTALTGAGVVFCAAVVVFCVVVAVEVCAAGVVVFCVTVVVTFCTVVVSGAVVDV